MNSSISEARVGRDIWTQFAGVVLIGLGVAGLMGWKTDAASLPLQRALFRRHILCNTAPTAAQVQAKVARVQAEIARQQAERIAEQLRSHDPL